MLLVRLRVVQQSYLFRGPSASSASLLIGTRSTLSDVTAIILWSNQDGAACSRDPPRNMASFPYMVMPSGHILSDSLFVLSDHTQKRNAAAFWIFDLKVR